MSISDIFVQKKIQGGDIDEFERLFEKHYASLCRQAFTITHDMDAAEDIVQEFFYVFWKNRETREIKVSLNAYMYQSVKINAIQFMERKTAHLIHNAAFLIENDQQSFDAAAQLELHELSETVKAILMKLPARSAKIFQMNRFEGKKYREIAEILSISIKTVEADMGKALAIFRQSLSEYKSVNSVDFPNNGMQKQYNSLKP